MQNVWAIFFELIDEDTAMKEKKLVYDVKWTFNSESVEFEENTLRLIKAFQTFGQDFYGDGQGAATVILDIPEEQLIGKNREDYQFIRHDELFIVSLGRKYFFVISNIEITARVLEYVDIPYEMDQLIRGVLSGQGSILYATLLDRAKSNQEEKEVDQLYRTILEIIQPKCLQEYCLDDLVKDQRCSLSPLTLSELLLFHNHIRKFFRTTRMAKKQDPWALAINLDGNEAFLDYKVPHDTEILSGLLAALNHFTKITFGTVPKSIIFGDCTTLNNLFFFNGIRNALVVNQPRLIFNDPYFHFLLLKTDKTLKSDLLHAIEKYLIQTTVEHFDKSLEKLALDKQLALYHQVIGKGLTPEVKPLELKDIRGVGKVRKQKLYNKGIKSIAELLNYKITNGEKNWLIMAKNNAEKLFEKTGGWSLRWKQ